MEFYSALYKSENSDIPTDLENLVSVTITEEENARLIKVPDGKEI